jgi:hypothetical protein
LDGSFRNPPQQPISVSQYLTNVPTAGVAKSSDFSRPGSAKKPSSGSMSTSTAAGHRRSASAIPLSQSQSLSNHRRSETKGTADGDALYSTSGNRMVACYSCGQSYSIFSIGPHLATCPRKRLANYAGLPPHLRPATPKPPITIIPPPDATIQEIATYNEEAKEIYYNHMSLCPSILPLSIPHHSVLSFTFAILPNNQTECGRRFDGQRILPHFAACKGGNGLLLSGLGGGGAGGSSVEFRWSPFLLTRKMQEERIAAGLSPEEAEAQAMLESGLQRGSGQPNLIGPTRGMNPQEMEQAIARIVGERIGAVASSVGRALAGTNEARDEQRRHSKKKSSHKKEKKKKSSSRKSDRKKKKKSRKHRHSSDESSSEDEEARRQRKERRRLRRAEREREKVAGSQAQQPQRPTTSPSSTAPPTSLADPLPKYLAETQAWKRIADMEAHNSKLEQHIARLEAQYTTQQVTLAAKHDAGVQRQVTQLRHHFDAELKRRDDDKKKVDPTLAERLRNEAERQGLLTPSYPFPSPSVNAPAFYPIDVSGWDPDSAQRVIDAHKQFRLVSPYPALITHDLIVQFVCLCNDAYTRKVGENESLTQLLEFTDDHKPSLHGPFVNAPPRSLTAPIASERGNMTYPYEHAQRPSNDYTQNHIQPPAVPAGLPFKVPFSQPRPRPLPVYPFAVAPYR